MFLAANIHIFFQLLFTLPLKIQKADKEESFCFYFRPVTSCNNGGIPFHFRQNLLLRILFYKIAHLSKYRLIAASLIFGTTQLFYHSFVMCQVLPPPTIVVASTIRIIVTTFFIPSHFLFCKDTNCYRNYQIFNSWYQRRQRNCWRQCEWWEPSGRHCVWHDYRYRR